MSILFSIYELIQVDPDQLFEKQIFWSLANQLEKLEAAKAA